MDSLDFCYWSLAITVVYLSFLLSQKRYRLLLPSVIHTFIWGITIFLIICQLKGILVTQYASDNIFNHSSRFICALMVASVIGFTSAHFITANQETHLSVSLIPINIIDTILERFKLVPYLCGIVGILLLIYLISAMGNIDSLGDYRTIAVTTKKVGWIEIPQRISGHINILGGFYLMLLGYKYGQTGINLKIFFKYALLCSAINMAIGGRVWILTSTLPFLTAYFFSRKYSQVDDDIRQSDRKNIFITIVIFMSLFAVIGLMRNESGESNFFDKFLYLTDGSRMTNMMLNTFPEGSYNYEYGKSTLLQPLIQSPMTQKFAQSISYDIGLSVTVKSIMPYLYYDFGFWGGAVFWGVICFTIEYLCIMLKYRNSVLAVLLFCLLSGLLFQSSVGQVFSVNMPAFEWLIILFVFRNKLFAEKA